MHGMNNITNKQNKKALQVGLRCGDAVSWEKGGTEFLY